MEFHIMGGDGRQLLLADFIRARGFTVTTSYLGGDQPPCWEADVLVLPLPCTRDGETLHAPLVVQELALREVFGQFRGRLILGGMLPDFAPRSAIDYYRAEEVLIANAALTAENALALAITKTPFALAGSPVLVLGGGRIGQLLAMKLKGLGAKVTVAARREETLALCRAQGCEGMLYEDVPYHRYRLVLNTVPARILNRERLAMLPREAVLIELASAPYGFDREEAKGMHLRVCDGASLPGKYSPETAAAVLGEFILKEMERHG